MKISLRTLSFTVFSLMVLFGCAREIEPNGVDVSQTEIVDKAQSVFLSKTSIELDKIKSDWPKAKKMALLNPGNYSPLWQDAVVDKKGGRIMVEVPINPEWAIYSYKRDSTTKKISRPWRRISQDVIVYPETDEAFVRSKIKRNGLLPTEKFTGVVIYSSVVMGGVRYAERYSEGISVEKISFTTDKISFAKNIKVLSWWLKEFSFFKRSSAHTKDGSDEGIDDWGDDPFWVIPDQDYDDMGDGIFIGEDGGVYYDSDGDGEPDTMMIEPAVCYGLTEEELADLIRHATDPDGGDDDGDDGDDGDGDDGYEDDFGDAYEDYLYVGQVTIDKMCGDISRGDVILKQLVNDDLVNVSTNVFGILSSVANYLQVEYSNLRPLALLGRQAAPIFVGIELYQTFIAFTDGGPLTEAEWLTVISAISGSIAIAVPIPMINAPMGIISGVCGLISSLINEQISDGSYVITLEDGRTVTIIISSVYA